MACRTLVPHYRGGVCRAEEATEETSGEGSEGRGALQHRVGRRRPPGIAFLLWPQASSLAGDAGLVGGFVWSLNGLNCSKRHPGLKLGMTQ